MDDLKGTPEWIAYHTGLSTRGFRLFFTFSAIIIFCKNTLKVSISINLEKRVDYNPFSNCSTNLIFTTAKSKFSDMGEGR